MMRAHLPLSLITAVVLGATGLSGCAHSYIAGTTVVDTPENRSVVDVLAKMQEALRARNADQLMALVSPSYFEDMGTPDPSDDYGYEQLRNEILPRSLEVTKELYVDMKVHDVVIQGDQAYANVRYSSRARLDLPAGTLWDTHSEFNRVEFALENGRWMITRGL